MQYVIESMQSTASTNILQRWEGPPVIEIQQKRGDTKGTIDERLQKLSALCEDISKRWEGHSTLEEIRFQREKDWR